MAVHEQSAAGSQACFKGNLGDAKFARFIEHGDCQPEACIVVAIDEYAQFRLRLFKAAQLRHEAGKFEFRLVQIELPRICDADDYLIPAFKWGA